MVRHSGFDSKRSHAGCFRAKSGPATKIPEAYEREAIRRADGHCQMCGRTVEGDGAHLSVDFTEHEDWCEGDALVGLRAICEMCYAGMNDDFRPSSINHRLIRTAMTYQSVHMRIGELLKTFGVGSRVPSSLIKAAAGQRNWRQRLRELRYPVIGWKIDSFRYAAPSGRRRSDYVLRSYLPWPPDPSKAVSEFDKARRKK